MAKLSTYRVEAKLEMIVERSIEAENLADAVERARTMREGDFVGIRPNSYNDGRMSIVGVSRIGAWDFPLDPEAR